MQNELMVTTAFDFDGFRITRNLGIVRGVTVRTRGIAGKILAGLRGIVGGQVEAYVSMCEVARAEAMEYMIVHAKERGANAVIGMRYDATEVGPGITEVLAYGTAVTIEAGAP